MYEVATMKVKFWGVRGSTPAPLTPEQVRSKIASVVQRIRPKDLESQRTREDFLSSLPVYLFGTAGGNTTCLEVRTGDGHLIILDGGSGLRELGLSIEKRKESTKEFPIFFTHFHWDHLQGIPFFAPAWVKGNRIIFASPQDGLEKTLKNQMQPPYFPVGMEAMSAEIRFAQLKGGVVKIGGAEVSWKQMSHPGASYAYKIVEDGKSLIFATDSRFTESTLKGREKDDEFFRSTDLLILDSQYTLEDSFTKFDFGHTSYTMAVNLAADWKVKNLVLFHHEPRYDDRKIFAILRKAFWHLDQLDAEGLVIRTAQEGLELDV
jgi:phosphoribosyl 1,2-cyclic phosphodiesterase